MNPTLSWLVTYAVHSTLLLGGALLLTWLGRPRSVVAREWMWRAALVGGFVGATLQTGLEVDPLAGRYAVMETLAPVVSDPAITDPVQEMRAQRTTAHGIPMELAMAPERTAPREERGAILAADSIVAAPRRVSFEQVLSPWRLAASALFLVGLWLVVFSWRTMHALGRREAHDGEWADLLRELHGRAGMVRSVRLTLSDRVRTPVALGILRPEICLPRHLVEAPLDPELARAALAHELGHLARLDPLWLGLAHALRTLVLWQPLHRVAARELTVLAELGADEWAAGRTSDPLSLARCLTEAAGWLEHQRHHPPAATCAMLRRRGGLEERVRRLLDEPAPGAPRASRLLAVAGVLAVPMVLPGLARPEEDQKPHPTEAPMADSEVERTWDRLRAHSDSLALQLEDIAARIEGLPRREQRGLEVRARLLQARLRNVNTTLAAMAGGENPTPYSRKAR